MAQPGGIRYERYASELDLPDISSLIEKDLSEPYSVYTYRYFLHLWPRLCFLAREGSETIGVIVCKLDLHTTPVKAAKTQRGYIAMLAVNSAYRKRGIGKALVKLALEEMQREGAHEVVLETEVSNSVAMSLYESLGFLRDKRLHRYYLNGVDAFRLKLWFPQRAQP